MGLIKRRARTLFRQKIRKPMRAALLGLAQSWCPDCQKRVQPFHVCAPRSDFKQRHAQQARAEKRRSKRASTASRDQHDYTACQDVRCPRRLCHVYREGRESCPLPHQG